MTEQLCPECGAVTPEVHGGLVHHEHCSEPAPIAISRADSALLCWLRDETAARAFWLEFGEPGEERPQTRTAVSSDCAVLSKVQERLTALLVSVAAGGGRG